MILSERKMNVELNWNEKKMLRELERRGKKVIFSGHCKYTYGHTHNNKWFATSGLSSASICLFLHVTEEQMPFSTHCSLKIIPKAFSFFSGRTITYEEFTLGHLFEVCTKWYVFFNEKTKPNTVLSYLL